MKILLVDDCEDALSLGRFTLRAEGYELEVIAMVALGGVSTSGGIGRVGGPILAIFIVGFLSYGMGLANMQAPVVLVVIGLLLIISVLAHRIRFRRSKNTSST